MRCVFLCPHTSDFSISGILQFTDPESETYLGQFFREEINLSDASNVKIFEYKLTQTIPYWALLKYIMCNIKMYIESTSKIHNM